MRKADSVVVFILAFALAGCAQLGSLGVKEWAAVGAGALGGVKAFFELLDKDGKPLFEPKTCEECEQLLPPVGSPGAVAECRARLSCDAPTPEPFPTAAGPAPQCNFALSKVGYPLGLTCNCFEATTWRACPPDPEPTTAPPPAPTKNSSPLDRPGFHPPMLDGVTQNGKVNCDPRKPKEPCDRIELTARFALIVPVDVLDELPYTREQNPDWWANRAVDPKDGKVKQGAASCDGGPDGTKGGHFFMPNGEPSILWWVCGGSLKYGTEPRHFDPVKPAEIKCSPGVKVTYEHEGGGRYGCFRNDIFNACLTGVGTCEICAASDLYTCEDAAERPGVVFVRGTDVIDPAKSWRCASGKVVIPVRKRCVTRAVDTRRPGQ